MPILSPETLQQRLRAIRLVIFDVDGVLTDGRLILGDDGQEYKAFNSKDGLGMRLLADSGISLAILTGRRSQVVERRAADLGIEHVIQGQRHKLPAFEKLLKTTGHAPEAVAYVGDDVVDLPVMRRVAVAVAVADASPLIHEHAHWITAKPGGHGAAREVCERILQAQGSLDRLLVPYLN